jgi:hypothetical protein
MPNPKSVKRKLDKKVIKQFGIDTILIRKNDNVELDMYGEPVDGSSGQIIIPVRIVIDRDKMDNNSTAIGGMPDPKKEFLMFFVGGDADIRSGDEVVYPANTNSRWLIDIVEPNLFKDVVIITEVKAFRDPRY